MPGALKDAHRNRRTLTGVGRATASENSVKDTPGEYHQSPLNWLRDANSVGLHPHQDGPAGLRRDYSTPAAYRNTGS